MRSAKGSALVSMSMNDNSDNKERAANALLVKRELFEFFKSDSLSEEGLHEIIERHGLTPNNSNSILISGDEIFLCACCNERVEEGIIRCLIEYFPDAASETTDTGNTPLHYACLNKSMTREIIQLLVDAAPDTLRSVNSQGYMPLHFLCANERTNETAMMKLLTFLIEKFPEAVRHADNNKGRLPIHIAAQKRSPEFCRVLTEAYPGSERITNSLGMLPLHCACLCGSVATVQYLYKLYPDAINHAAAEGFYPIHAAIKGMSMRGNPETAIEIVQHLLDCDPNVKFQKCRGKSLFHYACQREYDDSNIDAALEIIKVIYDAHPEAIEDNRIAANNQRYHQQVQSFIRSELVYARQAKDQSDITTPDDNGRLPLHTALQNSVRLGSIKLLVKGNPSAIRTLENSFALPLHIACEHHDFASVVEYLLDLDRRTLRAVDIDNNTALHYACRSAKYDTIALLLDKYDAASVSKRNANGKIPIDLLWESNAVGDRVSVAYTESVFRLLKAYPETVVLNCSDEMNQHGTGDDWSAQNGKKRKLGAG